MERFFSVFLIVVVFVVVLLIIIIPFPQYWASSSSKEQQRIENEVVLFPSTPLYTKLDTLTNYFQIPQDTTQFLGFIDRITVLCLKKRLDGFKNRMNKTGLLNRMYILQAIEGASLDINEMVQIGFQVKGKEVPRKNELACALGHLIILKDFLKDPSQEHMLILEDDITIGPHDIEVLTQCIQELKKRKIDFDLFFAGYTSEHRNINNLQDVVQERKDFKYIWKMKECHTTSAYIVSRAGAAKILLKMPPFAHAIDWYYGDWTKRGLLISYGSIFQLFHQDRKNIPSIIGNQKAPMFQFFEKSYTVSYNDLIKINN